MGFIGGYITPDFGITGEDRKNAYYVIDGIQFNSDITTTDDIVITIIFIILIFIITLLIIIINTTTTYK